MSGTPPSSSGWSLRGLIDAALWLGVAGVALLCALTLAAFADDRHWALEVTTHFRPHYAALLVLGTIIYRAFSHPRIAVVCFLFALLNGAVLLPRFYPHPVAPRDSTRIKLLLANVNSDNTRHAALLDLIERENPDVIALLEVNDTWLRAVESLTRTHPHHRRIPRSDNFGIAVFSRLPANELKTVFHGDAEVPSIHTTLKLPGRQTVALLATHPVPPGSAEGVALRDGQLRELARFSREQNLPLIVLGDLNCTPWSTAFTRLLKDGALHDTGHGIAPTWPVKPWLLRVPLDHCLVTEPLHVREHRVGPDIGSDHFPIIVTLALPPPGRR